MNSEAWQQRIVDLESEIRGKEARLAMLAHAKAEAITEPTKLLLLEVEESELPTAIAQLRRRLPILDRELENALQIEAEERLPELEKQGADSAARVSASAQAIRFAMQSLLDTITAAHESWDLHGLLAAEADYLAVRFTLPHVAIPRGDTLAPEETRGFKAEFDLLLRHSRNRQPWARLLADFQEAQRRQESQRRADADKELAPGPRPNPYRHLSKTYA